MMDMSLEQFKMENPQSYALLVAAHEIPPRRTLVDLTGGEIHIFCQPDDITRSTKLEKFPMNTDGASRALALLEWRRVSASCRYDAPLEASAEVQEQRLLALKTEREKRLATRRRKPSWRPRRARYLMKTFSVRLSKPSASRATASKSAHDNVIPLAAASDQRKVGNG